MPNSIPKSSPKKTFQRGFKKAADEISIDCRKQLNLNEYDPLESFSLAKHLNLEVMTPTDFFGQNSPMAIELLNPPGCKYWSAVTLAKNAKPSHIIYNTSHSIARTQSDIMHELAHVLLGHKLEEIDMSLGIPLRDYDESQENEAEWLGGCLQLPKTALVKYIIYKEFSVDKIAELFNASLQMVRYRISVCGINVLKDRIKNKGRS